MFVHLLLDREASEKVKGGSSFKHTWTMGGGHLVLDPAIRDWVVFPLMLMVILVGVLRHQITALLKSDNKPLDKEELSHK